MELREIEAFLAVARHRHFGRAAEQLGRSTSRVSQTIRAFERRVGAPVFERTSRRVELTEFGVRLFANLRPAYEQLEAAVAEARKESGFADVIVRVAFGASLPTALVPRMTSAFAAANPTWTLVTHTLPAIDFRAWLEVDGLDVFVTWIPGEEGSVSIDRLEIGPTLYRVARAACVPVGHPLAGRRQVSIHDLADETFIRPIQVNDSFMDAWTPPTTADGRTHRQRIMAGNYLEEALRLVVQEGAVHLSVTTVAEHIRDRATPVVVIPLTGLPPMRIAPLWRKDGRTARTDAFVASCFDALRQD